MLLLVTTLAVSSLVHCFPEPEAGLGVEHLHTLSRMKRGGACETTADCVSGNQCSKWGWCQWTTIYGTEGPSQGSAAPAGGKAGQCVTSADCASRVPYCSKLGFCHGGRLPFDEEQLEIADQDKTDPFEKQPQGFINNNPAKNSPVVNGKSKPAGAKSGGAKTGGGRRQGGTAANRGGKRPQPGGGGGGGGRGRKGGSPRTGGEKTRSGGAACPGNSVESCLGACEEISLVKPYTACVKTCSTRC